MCCVQCIVRLAACVLCAVQSETVGRHVCFVQCRVRLAACVFVCSALHTKHMPLVSLYTAHNTHAALPSHSALHTTHAAVQSHSALHTTHMPPYSLTLHYTKHTCRPTVSLCTAHNPHAALRHAATSPNLYNDVILTSVGINITLVRYR